MMFILIHLVMLILKKPLVNMLSKKFAVTSIRDGKASK